MDEQAIRNEAKKIMDNFMGAMDSIQVEEDFVLERKECFRSEGEGNEVDDSFRQRFLANATKTKGDAVLANKGDWEK